MSPNILEEQQQLADSLTDPVAGLSEGKNPAAAPAPESAATTPKPAAKRASRAKVVAAPAKTALQVEDDEPVKKATGATPETTAHELRRGKMVQLMIADSGESPPGGIFLAINGHSYRIQPGEWVTVPTAVVRVLENAVEEKPVVKDGQIVGYRKAHRFPHSTKPVAAASAKED